MQPSPAQLDEHIQEFIAQQVSAPSMHGAPAPPAQPPASPYDPAYSEYPAYGVPGSSGVILPGASPQLAGQIPPLGGAPPLQYPTAGPQAAPDLSAPQTWQMLQNKKLFQQMQATLFSDFFSAVQGKEK